MSRNDELTIPDILRLLADQIEKNPKLLDPKRRSVRKRPDIDLFGLVSKGGEDLLREELEKLDIDTLRQIVRTRGFDTSRLAGKWKNKQRLIDLIVKKTMYLSTKGDVFLYG